MWAGRRGYAEPRHDTPLDVPRRCATLCHARHRVIPVVAENYAGLTGDMTASDSGLAVDRHVLITPLSLAHGTAHARALRRKT